MHQQSLVPGRVTTTVLTLCLAASLLSTGLLSTALLPADALAAGDPFAPAGHERVRVEIADPQDARRLVELGFQPEDGGHDHLNLLVDADGRARLEALGYAFAPVEYEASGDDRTITTWMQLSEDLALVAFTYPDLTELTVTGTTVQGRQIWALKVSDNPLVEEFEPEVRIIGAHHGNEQMSVQMNVRMYHYLLENYGTDPTATELVDGLEIWFIPMMNADGFEANARYNSRNIDLNRNYGYMWQQSATSGYAPFSEPETRAIRDNGTDNWFSLSLSFHCSGDYVNSVWNYSPNYTEDDDVVWDLTTGYAGFSGYTPIRGWYWYETHGDCNDFAYGARSDIDWTIETDNFGEANVWNENFEAMLYFMDAAFWGLHGRVTSVATGEPLRARVWVEGNGWPVFTDPAIGDYHRVLLGGTYTIRFSANGHEDLVVPGVYIPAYGGATLDVELQAAPGYYADRIEIATLGDPNDQNATLSPALLGAPDDNGCSIGRGGEVIVDLGPGGELVDEPGDDVTVYESSEDAEDEGFHLYGGDSYLGPWMSIGAGSGTTSFDLAGTFLDDVRFIWIEDDGDGSASGAYPGFELDAIESLHAGTTTGIALEEPAASPSARLTIHRAAPNPVGAGERLRLSYSVPSQAPALIRLFDVSGRLVTTLAQGHGARAAERDLSWVARDGRGRPLPAGVYLLQLSAGEATASRKILVVQ